MTAAHKLQAIELLSRRLKVRLNFVTSLDSSVGLVDLYVVAQDPSADTRFIASLALSDEVALSPFGLHETGIRLAQWASSLQISLNQHEVALKIARTTVEPFLLTSLAYHQLARQVVAALAERSVQVLFPEP